MSLKVSKSYLNFHNVNNMMSIVQSNCTLQPLCHSLIRLGRRNVNQLLFYCYFTQNKCLISIFPKTANLSTINVGILQKWKLFILMSFFISSTRAMHRNQMSFNSQFTFKCINGGIECSTSVFVLKHKQIDLFYHWKTAAKSPSHR